MEDVKEFLGRHAEKLDKFVIAFRHSFKEQERKGLRHHIDSVNALYTKCLQCLLRDSRLKVLAKQEWQMSLLKQAVEMYIHHGIHDFIFKYVGSIEASQDGAFNKITRSLQHLQQKDLSVKSEFCFNIPRAKRELSQLNRCTSPQHKLLCLHKVVLTIMQPPTHAVNIEAMCADDLLSVLLYLLVKTEIPNWMANLSYIKNFRFCHSAKDDLSYCLTSFEAAVEYISQGNLAQGPAVLEELSDKAFLRHRMNLVSQNAATPIDCLFEHIANGNEAEVRRLLSEGESEEDRSKLCHPLCSCDSCERHLSGKLNDPSIVTPFSRDDRGYTPLHVAAVYGQSQLIDLLVSKGALVNATDYHALTPLHLSCQKGYQSVTLLLLHYKGSTNAQDNNGNTPLHLACMYGHEDCVKALVYYDLHSCYLDIQNDKGDTPLHIAARWGYEGIIEVLLENGANTALLNKAKNTPFQCALNAKILALLEQNHSGSHSTPIESPRKSPQHQGEPSSRRSSMSSTSSLSTDVMLEGDRLRLKEVEKLLRAVADGDVEMIRYLLEWLDEDVEDEETGTQLQPEFCHPLCQCPRCEPLQKKFARLQTSGLGVNCSTTDGFTPLHVAALHGHAALVSLLIRHGANINARNAQSATPLHLACQNSHVQVVTLLLECNAKVNKKDQYGNTPLIHACLQGHLNTAGILLKSGASVNMSNQQGNAPLHEAVKGSHLALAELLVKAGASVQLRNKRQRTPLDCALEMGGKNVEIVRILQKASGLSSKENPNKSVFSREALEKTPSVEQSLKAMDDSLSQRQDEEQSKPQCVQKCRSALIRESWNSTGLVQTEDRAERGKLRRGETVESSAPSLEAHDHDGGHVNKDRLGSRNKTLTRRHTVFMDHSPGPQGAGVSDKLMDNTPTTVASASLHQVNGEDGETGQNYRPGCNPFQTPPQEMDVIFSETP
ncbi:ankyrin repeat domain-containing protein 27-like isoform X2 [Scleropages formosus]|nr:ankyrin repeat domain-containing protein 27-like isoform X2 [Scleropages formosus]